MRSCGRSPNTMPTALGPGGDGLDLRFTDADGRERKTSAVVLVSNNPYRLGRAIASGTRPRLDTGVLGIAVLGAAAANDGERRAAMVRAIVRSPLTGRSRPASTARRSSSSRPCSSQPARGPYAYSSLRNTRVPPRPRPCRKARGTRSAQSPTSPPTVSSQGGAMTPRCRGAPGASSRHCRRVTSGDVGDRVDR